MKDRINVFWFRRDLRLEDNHGLFRCLKSGSKVLPIFIFDTNILEKLPRNDARVTFIHKQLSIIDNELKKEGSGLQVFFDTPVNVFKYIAEHFEVDSVFTNRDYEPYGMQRDQKVLNLLKEKNIGFKTFKDHVVFEQNEVVKDDGTPYKVYTPYSKKWITVFGQSKIDFFPSEDFKQCFVKGVHSRFLSLSDINFVATTIEIPSFNVEPNLIDNYEKTRDYPSLNGTSKLGVHLRFGTVSVRKMVKKALESDNIIFLKELIWREFFIQILWHYPHTVTKSFKPKYDAIIWRNNKEEFEKWYRGETGYPLVDAGMRELNQTGFMHNRVRMLVGSFLCKHLLIDWRWGEAYFAEKLLDFELSSNVGNWQWVAGCGVDAAPYFRIFNPTTQIQKFDKQLKYIKKWVPEHQELTYFLPMVEHKYARERCLKTYKEALN